MLLTCGAAMMLLMAMAYAWLAFAPTGYADVEKSAASARERLAKNYARRIDSATSGTKTQGGAGRLGYMDVVFKDMTGEIVGRKSNPDPAKLEDKRVEEYFEALRRFALSDFPVSGWFACENPPPAGSSIMPLITSETRERMVLSVRSRVEQLRSLPARPQLDANTAAAINAYLDRLEDFLLSGNWDVPRTVTVKYGKFSKTYGLKVIFAIERACLRGDPERAVKILEAYLETLRIWQYIYLQTDQTSWLELRPEWEPLFWYSLAEVDNFPRAAWDRARAGLERMRMSEADQNDARVLGAIAWRNDFEKEFKKEIGRPSQNMWHFMMGGSLESAVNTALAPVANRYVDETCMSIKHGDPNEFDRKITALNHTLTLMNVADRHVLLYGTNRNMAVNYRLESVDRYADSLAATFECARKHVPLDRIRVERFGSFMTKWRKGDNELALAIMKFEKEHKHWPSSPEEIDSFINASGHGDDWRAKVTWFEPTDFMIMWYPAERRTRPNDPVVKGIRLSLMRYEPVMDDGIKSMLKQTGQ
ncbi:hypothetical protein LLG95_04350 [bacterium]|nr:hypothetical protein [bacterium]